MMSNPVDPVKPHVGPDHIAYLADRTELAQEAIAEALHINPTDLRCLRFVWSEPGMTPGRLADLTGLTSGAITGVLDRLDRAGLVRRKVDENDRRRTLLVLDAARGREVGAIYDPIEHAIGAILASYDERELAAIADFIRRAGDAMAEGAARIRADTRGGMVGEMFTAPLGDVDAARLVVRSGAPRFALRAAPLGPVAEARMVAELVHTTLRLTGDAGPRELVRATFAGPIPEVTARRGDVTISYKRRLEFRNRETRVGLSREVSWVIEVSGGLSELHADLRHVRFHELRLTGGVDDVHISLGTPDGTSRVRITGGARDVVVEHPSGTPVRVSVTGGAHEVRLGREHLRDIHGQVRLSTPGTERAADRFEVDVAGGARGVRVTTA
jgi:DNA-binding MarR family transcriptional regulator